MARTIASRQASPFFTRTLGTKLIRSASHARNFLDCVKSRAETICSIDTAVTSCALCHIADIAIRLDRRLAFDFEKERFTNDGEANRRLAARPIRKPWRV